MFESRLDAIAIRVFGTTDATAARHLLTQVSDILPARHSSQPGQYGFAAALETIAALKPTDPIERMLVTQMLATHEQAMECMRRANLPEQTFAGRELNLKYTAKLQQLYARQVEALDKHRGQAQQRITVEHVTVQAGGQAIVGSIETPAVPLGPRPAPAALEHKPDDSVPLGDAFAATPVPLARTPTSRARRK